jgi:hypothetical protein
MPVSHSQVGIIKLLKLMHSNVLYVHRKVAKKWNLDLLSLIAGVQQKVPYQRHWKKKNGVYAVLEFTTDFEILDFGGI